MQNSKLARFLKTFSREEIKGFDKFIRSPYFTTGIKVSPKVLSGFYKILMNYYPEFNSRKLSGEMIFNKLYPGKKYKDETMRNLFSVTLNLAEDFIALQGMKNQDNQKAKFQLTELRLRKNNFAFEKTFSKTIEELDKNPFNSEIFLTKHEIQLQMANYLLDNNLQAKAMESIYKQMEYLTGYFLHSITNNIYLAHAGRAAFNTKLKLDISEVFIKCFDYKSFISALKIAKPESFLLLNYEYLKIMMLLDPKDITYFYSLKNLMKKYPVFFDKEKKLSLYFKLVAFCIDNLNNNYIKFLEEEFILFKEVLKDNLGLETVANGFFPLHQYRNMILTATELKESKWLEGFLKKYINYIPPGLRSEINEFGIAFLLYSKENYEKALEHTVKIHYKHHVIQMDITILRLKIYYQLDYIEDALYLTDSFKHFLVNNKSISSGQRAVHTSFTNYLNKIIRLRMNGNFEDTQTLKNKITNDPKVSNKYWLLEKIDKL